MADQGDWAGLADDLPDGPQSVLQPQIEALAIGDKAPAVEPQGTENEAEVELWLLGRACAAACLLALQVRSDLDRHSLARLVADGLDDDRRSALAEDIVVALGVPSTDGTVDPTRIVRSDSRQVMGGFVDCLVILSRLIADRVDQPPDRVVRLCFAGADGTLNEFR